ncbi:MAG TPA: TetR/AcrR family transcriptional regulator [Polyangiaceae bacterium]|jgi:AcrR family transcriptional regulator|nr:TetR/AcrR family transcriptional regulator [Polyangiaceae bacterium]
MSVSAVSQTGPRQGTTRERLLEAAIEMFAERGYAATGVDALCRKAGVAKTGLYWEFQNKVGLLNAVIDQVVTEWVDQIREAACAAGSPRERLDVALTMVRRRVEERPEVFRVLLVVLAERTQVDEEAREALRRFYRSAHAALLSGFQESMASTLPAGKLSIICDFILAMIEGVLLRSQVYGSADIDRLFDVMRASIILLVRELVASAQGQATVLNLISDAPPAMEQPSGT